MFVEANLNIELIEYAFKFVRKEMVVRKMCQVNLRLVNFVN